MTDNMYGAFFGGMLTGLGALFTAVVTSPATLAIIVILVLLATLSRLVPAKRRRRRR